MDKNDAQIKILAQAVYELRFLLSNYLGCTDKGKRCETVSAHLAYALHNEALAIVENRPEDFDIDKAIEKIKFVDERYGENFGDRFQELVSATKT